MAENSLVYWALVVGVVVGLVVVVYGEATGGRMAFVLAGGMLVVLCVGVLAAIIARMPGGEHGEAT